MTQRCTGFIQHYNRQAGYGFLIPLGHKEPLYFEEADLEGGYRGLSVDQQVTFVFALGEGRFVAKEIRT
ncbi:cold shock domain-containing protein [Streptomyces sp. NBC_00335]|uniref:cold shock domain-containing protein n=1 Tax=unclassified Streptomyces TaxID=2593676 RepID=UPI002256116A|nr:MULTISPECIES: cold shock domain-containing protein [unclassified Streptomyces]MCX5410243.1 cold shock domain-containing protein [Streptomyces sp. NBC_00086]